MLAHVHHSYANRNHQRARREYLRERLCDRGSGDEAGEQADENRAVVCARLGLHRVVPQVDVGVVLEWTSDERSSGYIWVRFS